MKKTLTTILLTAIIVGAPLGIFAYNLNLGNENRDLQEQVDAGKGQIVSSETLMWDSRPFIVEHMCAGNLQQANFPGTPGATYCLGENRLQLKDENGYITVLSNSTVDAAANAPLMNNVYLIPGTEDGRILLNYGPNDCDTANNCGVGYSPFTEWMISLADNSARVLENIPTSAESGLVWNSTGTKALIATSTESGTGYSLTTIKGYDWVTDTVTGLTTEKAAYGEQGRYSLDAENYQDVDGSKLPYWSPLDASSWTDETHVKVTLNNADGTKKELTGSF